MANDNLDLSLDQGKAKKKKLIIIIAVVVVLLLAGGGAAFFLLSGGDAPPAAETAGEGAGDDASVGGEGTAEGGGEGAEGTAGAAAGQGAIYVAMPRPFIFNVSGSQRDRVVQIKVQLLVRGSDNELLARKHIPLIESALLTTFAQISADELATIDGKEQLRVTALAAVREAIKALENREVVAEILFTGFVMQ